MSINLDIKRAQGKIRITKQETPVSEILQDLEDILAQLLDEDATPDLDMFANYLNLLAEKVKSQYNAAFDSFRQCLENIILRLPDNVHNIRETLDKIAFHLDANSPEHTRLILACAPSDIGIPAYNKEHIYSIEEIERARQEGYEEGYSKAIDDNKKFNNLDKLRKNRLDSV